ncbi:MAG: hypothetical protein LBH93_07440 [Chitinispirillales bacterium]|jgi:hypothetical protein|nr:hypothetical protein [Chitinispirillales bacterium]
MTIRIAAASILASCLLCGCSIFDLKNPEAPTAGAGTDDPLNIGDILSIVREPAADMDYADYFAENAVFEYTQFRTISRKSEVINMLNNLRPRASLVEWQVEKAEKRFDGNLQIIENVPYTVYSGGKVLCIGLADFHLVREPDWMINYWKDVPNGGYTPFFEPSRQTRPRE